MIWSKLKRAIEHLLAEDVKAHLQLHLTRYGPGVSGIMNRAWLTWDGVEIATCSTIQSIQASAASTQQSAESSIGAVSTEAAGVQRTVFARDDFYDALESYTLLPIDEALGSANPIIRALAMFDLRLGKRRLRTLPIGESDPQLVQRCYRLRCSVERIAIDEREAP